MLAEELELDKEQKGYIIINSTVNCNLREAGHLTFHVQEAT